MDVYNLRVTDFTSCAAAHGLLRWNGSPLFIGSGPARPALLMWAMM